ncbi:unnamed protein product [Rotaria magnacalcarata]|uniref:Ubiquitin carboxyl-terminal hydrolase n=2 Tax=Rotaria magnacalcarata TaxID=392030 RepID=A0A815U291_9BILA|nr:unnamed protein product [Rotaria magnacalcarata]CAF1512697.1 unnamed protein product [Rotaria magnacalcarata]CAF2071307.1 unnamed protein product [Rotaria magnacalcarata]CAF3831773.1 unnamed protein product [Rotaria magnacalcarata]CAF3895666.1 unnamed protein product [Rotaria magnacalcarata]
MLHGSASYFMGCSDPRCPKHSGLQQKLELQLQYSDRKHDIELQVNVDSSPKITICDIIKELLNFLYLDDISPEEVRLVGVKNKNKYFKLNVTDIQKTLRELHVTTDCILHFEPTSTASAPKPCQLTIFGPDEKEKKIFQWYRAKTTLAILLEYVIEIFSLQSIDRHQLHLFTICDELDLFSCSTRRLIELGVNDRMAIYVQIVSSSSLMITNENIDVHVEYGDEHEKSTINVRNTETMGELKIQIQKRYEGYRISEFECFNERKDLLASVDTDKSFKSLGIKPGQKVFVKVRLTSEKNQLATANAQNKASNQSDSPSSTKANSDKVIVKWIFPMKNSEKTEVSLQHTVNQLIKKLEALEQNNRLVLHKLSSDVVEFVVTKSKETHRSLADLGFKSNDTIDATIKVRSPKYSSIVSKESPPSLRANKIPKVDCITKSPIGLNNLGNTCYMNSAIQCLAHIPPLTNFFLEGFHYTHMNDGEHTDEDWNPFDKIGSVTGAYADLLWNLWKHDDNDHDYASFKPIRIKDTIGNKELRFSTNDQQDAQEFMTYFLDAIHKELKEKNDNSKYTIIKQLFFGEIKSIIRCTTCNNDESTISPVSFLSIPLNRQERKFWITYISKLGKDETVCVDVPISGHVGHVVEEFVKYYKQPALFYHILALVPDGELDFGTPLNQLSHDEIILMEQEERSNNKRPENLEIPAEKLTLQDCLKDFFSPEHLEAEWTCRRATCKKKTTATKQLELYKLPPIIVIQFKRFSHENGLHQKIETFVKYPINELNLNAFSTAGQQETVYDLIATSNHIGSIYAGHYIAYAMHRMSNKSEWYRFDDSCVTRVKLEDLEQDIVSQDAYLLFYIKRDILNPLVTV